MRCSASPRAASQSLQSVGYDAMLGLAERLGMGRRRADLLSGCRGRVLEIGAGTGLNLAHYPPTVQALLLTEPDPAMAGRLRRRAAQSELRTTVVVADAQVLPVADASVDVVVSTLVLCTVPDAPRAVAEIVRVLRPDGRFVFIEHVRADRNPRGWLHDWLDPLWTRIALGCHVNRDTVEVLHEGGLTLDRLETDVWRGMPGLVRPLVMGQARR